MDARYERLFDPGQARVYPGEPLPQRDPMRALADWGAPPTPDSSLYRLDDERSYASPGPPPWVEPKRTPAWALASILVGSALLLVVAAVILARVTS